MIEHVGTPARGETDLTQSAPLPRWVLARTSSRAHLDLGDRSSQSLRVRGEHIIVSVCQAHVAPTAQVVAETYSPRCSHCQRFSRSSTRRHVDAPDSSVAASPAGETRLSDDIMFCSEARKLMTTTSATESKENPCATRSLLFTTATIEAISD